MASSVWTRSLWATSSRITLSSLDIDVTAVHRLIQTAACRSPVVAFIHNKITYNIILLHHEVTVDVSWSVWMCIRFTSTLFFSVHFNSLRLFLPFIHFLSLFSFASISLCLPFPYRIRFLPFTFFSAFRGELMENYQCCETDVERRCLVLALRRWDFLSHYVTVRIMHFVFFLMSSFEAASRVSWTQSRTGIWEYVVQRVSFTQL